MKEEIMSTADWIQTILLLVTIIGLIITIINNRKQLQILNEQSKLNFFAEYTKRYQEIIINLPENISDKKFQYSDLSKEVKDKTLRYMRAYFDLCSEEYDLWRAGYIDDRIWKNWKEGIEFAFTKKAVKEAWKTISDDTFHYPEFSNWINSISSD